MLGNDKKDQAVIKAALMNSLNTINDLDSQHNATNPRAFQFIIRTAENVLSEDLDAIESGVEILQGVINDEFAAHPQIQQQLKDALLEPSNILQQMRSPSWRWVREIDFYDAFKEQKQKGEEVKFSNMQEKVNTLLSPEAKALLYQGASRKPETSAREKYYEHLSDCLQNLPEQTTRPRPTIKINQLLGPKGIELYKAAIAEEESSQDYRNMAFLLSVQHFDGPSFDKKLMLVVAGPSASGKTFAANTVVKNMSDKMPSKYTSLKNEISETLDKLIEENPYRKAQIAHIQRRINNIDSKGSKESIQHELNRIKAESAHIFKQRDAKLQKLVEQQIDMAIDLMPNLAHEGNDIVSIDGDNERRPSKIRQDLLQVALAKGYKSISDLHSNTKFHTKQYIKEAALAQDGLSLVMPETFAESMLGKRFDAAGPYKKNELRGYQDRDDMVLAFSRIVAPEGHDDRFQRTVADMGGSRAHLSESDSYTVADIETNNRDLPCESKEYGKYGFNFGKWASEEAEKIYKEMNPTGWTFQITNDLICLCKGEDGQWFENRGDNPTDLRLSFRDFREWVALRDEFGEAPVKGLEEWYQDRKALGNLAPPLIKAYPNDLISIPTLSDTVPNMSMSERDFLRWQADPTDSSLLDWCLQEYENARLITPLDIIIEESKLAYRRKSAPDILQSLKEDKIDLQVVIPRRYSDSPAQQPRKKSSWIPAEVSSRAVLKDLQVLEEEELQQAVEEQVAKIPTKKEEKFSKEEEFIYAQALLDSALEANADLDSFKISKKDHKENLDHSFVCLKKPEGGFEIYRMAAEILGRGQEGKVKVIENSKGEQLVVKISQAPGADKKQKMDEELEMMEDMGLLVGQFTREREKKFDKVMQRDIGDKQYVVQEYIKGKELADLLKEQKLDELQKLKILREALYQLVDLNQKGIIHRDIKPENMIITLDKKGDVRDCTFIDYGVSIKNPSGNDLTRGYAGSPKYMAPELGREDFYAKYREYLQVKKELTDRIAMVEKESSNPDGLLMGKKKIYILKQQLEENEKNYLAVLGEQKTFNSGVDKYSLGILAKMDLGLNLDDLGIEKLMSSDPADRMAPEEAVKKIQNQINVLHSKALSDSDKKIKPKEVQQEEEGVLKMPVDMKEQDAVELPRVDPIEDAGPRRPKMVKPQTLHNIKGKMLYASAEQLLKINKIKSRGAEGQSGVFEVDGGYFVIDDNKKPYAIYQSLASGAFGSVSLGQNLQTGEWVAIKFSGARVDRRGNKPHVIKTLESEDAILQELGELVGEVSSYRGQMYKKTEEHMLSIQPFAFGEEYFDVNQKNENVPASQCALMSLRMFEQLAQLHDKGILHLDIKPENMKWDDVTNQCKILDMGTATKDKGMSFTTPAIIGTEAYFPPEVKNNAMDRQYSNKGDVYAAALSIQPLLDKADGFTEPEKLEMEKFLEKALNEDPNARPSAQEASKFFHDICLKMQSENRLDDTSLSLETTLQQLSEYAGESLGADKKEQVSKGVGEWMRASSSVKKLSEKAEIAHELIAHIKKHLPDVEITPENLPPDKIANIADFLVEARAANIEDLDSKLEVILKAPSDQVAKQIEQELQVKQIQEEKKVEAKNEIGGRGHKKSTRV